ncbi:MAG: acetyl-CoA hydrolase/transferase C-terminal domain-containing protein [Pseudomonadota bacterium]
MHIITRPEEAVNAATLPPGSRIYCGGNAATPQILLRQLVADPAISGVELVGVLLLGDIATLFEDTCCERVTHRVIFNSAQSRRAVNCDAAMYQLIHLSDIPHQLKHYLMPDVVFLSVAGPDNGGNYSLGPTVEALPAAIDTVRARGGKVIAERNAQLPFVLGTTLRSEAIDFLIDTNYPLPVNPSPLPDDRARKIGDIITARYIHDGCTLQYGIGEVPGAVTDAILKKGVKDLGIHTELFASAMKTLIDTGVATNRRRKTDFGISTLFLMEDAADYQWLGYNSSMQSRPCDVTNNILHIAAEPNMVAVNSAIGVDLHGNIWADSLNADRIYSGIGGQSDFLRGAYLSEGGVSIIAMKSTTAKGASKVVERSPEGISATAIAADPVVVVTENGAFDPRGLSISEHAVGIAHLAAPEVRDALLKHIFESDRFHKPRQALSDRPPKGFTPYSAI